MSMDWEGDPEPGRPRGRLRTVVVLVAMVAGVAWLARSPATTPDDLTVEDASDPTPNDPTPDPPPGPTPNGPTPDPTATDEPGPSIEGVFGLDAVLPVRPGTWEEVQPPDAVPPATADGPASEAAPPSVTHVWDGDELIRIEGATVRGHDPSTRAWRTLPDYPGDPAALKAPTPLPDGVLLIEVDVSTEPGAITTGGMWLLAPDDTWRELPPPPILRVASVAGHRGAIVVSGPDTTVASTVGDPDALWSLAAGNDVWEALPNTPRPVYDAEVLDTVVGLVLLARTTTAETGAVPETDLVTLLLTDDASGWVRLAPPPALAPGTQAVALPTSEAPEALSDQIMLLDTADEGRVLTQRTYDVAADEWTSAGSPEIPATAASALEGAPIRGGWDGADTVWFQSFAGDSVLFATDPATGALAVVARPRQEVRAFGRQLIPFPGGLFLTGGFVPGGALQEVDRLDRWTPADAPTAPPATDEPPTPAREIGTGANLGLDEVLPVVDGVWRELTPPAQVGPNPHRAAVWDGQQVVAAVERTATAFDPATNVWRPLPDLPIGADPQQQLQGVAVEGTPVMVASTAFIPAPEGPGRSQAWALVDDVWLEVTSIPAESDILGAVDGRILSVRYPGPGPTPRPQLWLSDPAAGAPDPLPDPPVPVIVTDAIETPEGFVILGSREVGGTGAHDDPFRLDSHALQWDGQTWRELSIPDMDLIGAGATWVPIPPGRSGEPDPAGGLVLVGPTASSQQLVVTSIDLANGEVDSSPLPITEELQRAGHIGGLSAAWDGADTVWVYGGYPTPLHLSLGLSTGELRVAQTTGGRTGADLVWAGEGLVLLGGFGATGQVETISRWTPGDAPGGG